MRRPARPLQRAIRAEDARLGITGVMVEAFNIIQDRISRARLAGDPPDLSLQPKLGHIGLSEFHRADEAIRIGYETTKAQTRRPPAAAGRAGLNVQAGAASMMRNCTLRLPFQ